LFFGNEFLLDVIVSDYVEIERFFFKNKKYEYVVKLANMSLGDEANVEEVSLLGHSYMKLGLYSDAYKTFMGLVDKGCNDASVVRGLGGAVFMLCKYDEAAAAYNRLIRENGDR
ncbi:tetratricopeptide repeat protein, partial [Prevotella sp.]|uniref:tetratricopeptide repeat protein n=1 Tax=Prevotella sp. TaxID=59823 RepID=UPI0040259B43